MMNDQTYNYSVFDASPSEFAEFATHAPKVTMRPGFSSGRSRNGREDTDEGPVEVGHRCDGLLPNMTWIIGLGGFIHYKSSWTSPSDVESTLEAILDFQTNRAKNEWVASIANAAPGVRGT